MTDFILVYFTTLCLFIDNTISHLHIYLKQCNANNTVLMSVINFGSFIVIAVFFINIFIYFGGRFLQSGLFIYHS